MFAGSWTPVPFPLLGGGSIPTGRMGGMCSRRKIVKKRIETDTETQCVKPPGAAAPISELPLCVSLIVEHFYQLGELRGSNQSFGIYLPLPSPLALTYNAPTLPFLLALQLTHLTPDTS